MTTNENFYIPDGMVLQKKGGRPKKESRNAAVFMARFWRTQVIGEPVKRADEWIVSHWLKHGGAGITEESSVRRSIRAASDLMTDRYMVFTNEKGFLTACPLPLAEGGSGWLWMPEMMDAAAFIMRNFKMDTYQETYKRTPVNLAAFHATR